jgi:hypothetical protein
MCSFFFLICQRDENVVCSAVPSIHDDTVLQVEFKQLGIFFPILVLDNLILERSLLSFEWLLFGQGLCGHCCCVCSYFANDKIAQFSLFFQTVVSGFFSLLFVSLHLFSIKPVFTNWNRTFFPLPLWYVFDVCTFYNENQLMNFLLICFWKGLFHI